jgi:hypothetical protein
VLQKCRAQSTELAHKIRAMGVAIRALLSSKDKKKVEEMKPKSPHAPAKPIRPPERLREDAEARVIRHYIACCS